VPLSAGASEAVGVTIHEVLCVRHDWFFVCSSSVLNECLKGIGVKRLQFLHVVVSTDMVAANDVFG
jgi:hypothetical protein